MGCATWDIQRDPASITSGTLAVSFPGGSARQYRIQYQEENHSQWQLYATFGRLDRAEHCLLQLHGRGVQARLVSYRISPAAG